MSTNIYSLDNLISFNSKLENYFTNNTTKAINEVYESFLSKNINKLKNKDKSVLKEIPKLNINYVLIDNLNFLWNSGFNTNTNNFSSNILTTFTNQTKENISKNKKLTKTINKEDIKVAKNIRKRDIEEKRKTLRILKQDIITSDFGNTYLQERNKEIARNFTNTYQEKIFNSISNYFNQKLSITREKNLINHLSFKRLSDLNAEEKAEYINEYNKLADIYGLKVESLSTYDSLKFNPKERIRRIANTELSAAYNLARYNELVNQGFTEFQVKNTGNPDCVLCKSKNNTIITLEQIQNLDRGFTDFRGINTRKNKDASENTNLIFPPFHPNCFLAGTKVLMKEGISKNIEDITIGEKVVVGISSNNYDDNDYKKYTQKEIVRSVYNVMKNSYKDYLITLILENGKKITATRDHPIFNGTEFRSIGDFCIGDYAFITTEKDTSTLSNYSKNVFRGFGINRSNIEISTFKQSNCKTYSSYVESTKKQERSCTNSMDKTSRKKNTAVTCIQGETNPRNKRKKQTKLSKKYRSSETFFRKNENKQSFSTSDTQVKSTRRNCKIKKQKVLSKFRWNSKIFQILSRRFEDDFQKFLGSQFCKSIKSLKSTLVLRNFILQIIEWYLLQTRFLFTKTKSNNRNKRLYERRFKNKIKTFSKRISTFKTKNNRRKKISVSNEIFSGLTKLRVKEIQKSYYEGLVYNISVDECGDYNYYFASTDNCFVLTHNCRDYLVGVNKTKKILSTALNTINTTVKVANTISNSYLNLASKTNNTTNNVLKAILTTGSIMSLSMMYYFFTRTNLVPNFIVNNLEYQLSDVLLEGTQSVINNTNTTIQDQLKTAVLNKDFNQSSLYETGYKPPTPETLSQYLNTQQKAVINKQLTDSIKQLITKANLTEVFKYTIIDANGISGLIELAKNNQERETLQNVQTLVNALVVNNKTTSKQELLNLIYKEEVITKVIAKIPLNIKQQDLVLVNNTETKLVNSTTKLERLSTNITKLNNEVKKNKNDYLKDIETLRELDSELTEQLIGIERINSEYNQLLETTTDNNLSKYLTDKITENNQKTSELRNKLNNISADLYGTKLDKIDPTIKDELISNIRTKGEQYLDFRNNRTSKIKSINTTLNNAKKDTTIDKLNIEYIDKKLAQLDILDLELQDLNKDSLILDNILSDYAILSKIDTNSTNDLGYTFNNYLNTASKRNKQIANVDEFRETSLTNTATNLDTYKRKLLKAKAKLLNNEEIIEFSRYSKILCHSKLKNILEKLRKVD